MSDSSEKQRPNPDREKRIDDLIPLIADVIHHARGLQLEVVDATGNLVHAGSESVKAAIQLRDAAIGLENRIAKKIVEAVAIPFNKAVHGASATIAGDLGAVEASVTASVLQLKAASKAALDSIEGQAKRVEMRVLVYMGCGSLLGILVGSLATFMAVKW